MSDFDRKFEKAMSELDKAGIWPSNAYPPLQKSLNKLGWKSRTPHYAPFIIAFNVAAILFSGVWGSFMWIFIWSDAGMSSNRALSTALMTGVFFGIAMALYYAHGRKKYDLTPWDQL